MDSLKLLRVGALFLLSSACLLAEDPVIFWAHYMPQIPNGHLQSHPHVGGNEDAWTFTTQTSPIEEYKQHMRMALESGINGFQMLTWADDNAYVAARQIRAETGTVFYVSPEWCALPASPQQAGDAIADFALRHQDDDCISRRDGAQVHFLYNPGPWASTPEGIRAVMDRIKARGANVVLVPTLYWFDKLALDRPDLQAKAWPPGDALESGPVSWLKSTPWRAATEFAMFTDSRAANAVSQRLAKEAPSFFWIPSVSAGYDCSNRPGLAIRSPFNGVKTLLSSLRVYRQLGFRQLSFVTWNDVLESVLVPSSRNLWGYNSLLRFFHGLTESGKSPFAKPKIVVAFPAECLYGDKLWFQVLGLPDADDELEWRARVEWQGTGQALPPSLSGSNATSPSNSEALIEMEADSDSLLDKADFVQPIVTMEIRKKGAGEWRSLYDRVLLPPIHLRYNLAQFPNCYAVDLDRIATDSTVKLNVRNGVVGVAEATVSGSTPIRRLVLSDASMSLGAFRGADGPDKTDVLQNLFVRVEASSNVPLRLKVEKGVIHDLYSPNPDPSGNVVTVESGEGVFPAFPKGAYRTRVVRFDSAVDGRIDLGVDGADVAISATISELQKGVIAKKTVSQGKPIVLSMVLTGDATDPNIDFPLTSPGTFSKNLPLALPYEGVRTLHAMAWLANDKFVFSPAVELNSTGAFNDKAQAVEWIHTGGTFDSFVSPVASSSLNPFNADQVRQGLLPRNRVPYFHLGFSEGAGARLNDRGFSQQAGRAWTESRRNPSSHTAAYAQEDVAGFRWLSEGPFGKSMQLGPDAVIRFRSKSSPVGPETISLWVNVPLSKDGQSEWGALRAGPFLLDLAGKNVLTFQRAGIEAQVPVSLSLTGGWTHLAFVYDLKGIQCYQDGKLIGEKSDILPVYQRTHQSPMIAFERASSTAALSPKIANVEVIGCALEAAEVQDLMKNESWRPAD